MSAIPLPNQVHHTRTSRALRHADVTDEELGLKCAHWADQALKLHKIMGLSHSVASLCALINSAAVSSENCKRSAIASHPVCSASKKAVASDKATTKTKRVEAAEVNFRKLQRDISGEVTKFQMQLDAWQNLTEQERRVRKQLLLAADKFGKCVDESRLLMR